MIVSFKTEHVCTSVCTFTYIRNHTKGTVRFWWRFSKDANSACSGQVSSHLGLSRSFIEWIFIWNSRKESHVSPGFRIRPLSIYIWYIESGTIRFSSGNIYLRTVQFSQSHKLLKDRLSVYTMKLQSVLGLLSDVMCMYHRRTWSNSCGKSSSRDSQGFWKLFLGCWPFNNTRSSDESQWTQNPEQGKIGLETP